MESLAQNGEITPQEQAGLGLLNNRTKEPCDHYDYCRNFQPVNGVISDTDTKTEYVDLVHDDNKMELTTSTKGSTSESLTALKCEQGDKCKTNFIHENEIDREDIIIPKVSDVKREQSDIEHPVARDSGTGSEKLDCFKGDEKAELLTRRSDYLADKLRAVCKELKEEKDAEMGVSQMSSNILHTAHACPRANSFSFQVKVEPETKNEENDIFSCGMCYLVNSQPIHLQKNMRRDQQEYSETTESLRGMDSNTAIARNGELTNSTPSIRKYKEVQRLQIENLNCDKSPPLEHHLSEENAGQQVVQNCSTFSSFTSISDVKQSQSIPSCSKNYENLDSESQQDCYHLQVNERIYCVESSPLKVHQKIIYTEEKPYKCVVCGTEFSSFSSLQCHKRIHTGEKPYKCDVCDVGFARTSDLKIHKRTHTGEKPYKCDVCGVDFTQTGSLKRHKRIHPGEKPYKCNVCGMSFAETGPLKSHKRIHIGEKPYKCDICGVGFVQARYFKVHKRIHTGEKPYKCDLCGVGFVQSNNLKVHKRIHTGEKPYKCDVCGVRFTQKCHLKVHKRIHTLERFYTCGVSGVDLLQSNDLKFHKRLCTEDKPYKCVVCGTNFSSPISLQRHRKFTHTGEKPYKCDVCDVGFATTSGLKIHKRSHTGDKPYKCDVCGLDFTHTQGLKTHKRIHTGEKPYKCDVCGVDFTQTGSLKIHKRIHTGERPYTCDICGVGFAQAGNLKSHKRIHTGEKPYKCDVCGAGFTQKGPLKVHKRMHILETPYKCDICGVGFARIGNLKVHKRLHIIKKEALHK